MARLIGRWATAVALSLAVSAVALTAAAQPATTAEGKPEPGSDAWKKQAFKMFGDIGNNQLPFEGKRFRIDYQVDDISLVFFRERNSAPIILVLPDGSKWYEAKHPLDKVTWYSDETFDMVNIKQPPPGPWQVVGTLSQQSKAMVVTDVQFHAEPLPPRVFRGEKLKTTGYLTNGDDAVETSAFEDAVRLDVLFVSSNNPEYSNFGVDPARVGSFTDDGKGLDEKPGDGVFTGEFNLRLEEGEYVPTYRVMTPLYNRSEEAQPIVVEASPVTMEIKQAENPQQDHQLQISVANDRLQADSIVLTGTTLFPNGERREFTTPAMQAPPYSIAIPNLAFGRYLVRAELFATTTDGREIQLKLDDFQFITREIAPQPSKEQLAEQKRQQQLAEQQALAEQRAAEEAAATRGIVIVVMVNLSILLAAIGFVVWRRRKARQPSTATEATQEKTPEKAKNGE
ncbi:TIGR03503 family protein [Idiomarina xiamenensis]|uniref:TIGR03503 family protein n=1 Tax=Idiomarina xiamenensis TaxID=1207041 RepID=UPI00058EBF5C|nr:TIGR03503 family protein [Idiomarina xiamenensis]